MAILPAVKKFLTKRVRMVLGDNTGSADNAMGLWLFNQQVAGDDPSKAFASIMALMQPIGEPVPGYPEITETYKYVGLCLPGGNPVVAVEFADEAPRQPIKLHINILGGIPVEIHGDVTFTGTVTMPT